MTSRAEFLGRSTEAASDLLDFLLRRMLSGRKLFCLLLLVGLSLRLTAADLKLQSATTPDGVRYGWLGAKPDRPKATVFFFGGALENNLTEPRYLEAIRELGEDFWCVTLDLPCHGQDRRPDEPGSMHGWEFRLAHGEPFVAGFVDRASHLLDYFVQSGWSDPKRVGVFGTSRGGFLALQFAAADRRIGQVAAFAPVTDLAVIEEFKTMAADPRLAQLDVRRQVEALSDRRLWVVIGNHDERVDTSRTIDFVTQLLTSAGKRGQPFDIELHVETAAGHSIAENAYVRAARWLKGEISPSVKTRTEPVNRSTEAHDAEKADKSTPR
ncbi:MAG: esterase [Verrucomicrobia bacterium]|nr:esterase [Verrucomicrobiota bacterium]